MPGRVIDSSRRLVEKVVAGQKLLVTEAMKLETAVKAPIGGMVPGDRLEPARACESGDLLAAHRGVDRNAGV